MWMCTYTLKPPHAPQKVFHHDCILFLTTIFWTKLKSCILSKPLGLFIQILSVFWQQALVYMWLSTKLYELAKQVVTMSENYSLGYNLESRLSKSILLDLHSSSRNRLISGLVLLILTLHTHWRICSILHSELWNHRFSFSLLFPFP